MFLICSLSRRGHLNNLVWGFPGPHIHTTSGWKSHHFLRISCKWISQWSPILTYVCLFSLQCSVKYPVITLISILLNVSSCPSLLWVKLNLKTWKSKTEVVYEKTSDKFTFYTLLSPVLKLSYTNLCSTRKVDVHIFLGFFGV